MASATQKATAPSAIAIPPIEIKTYSFRIEGDSPLITHAWSEKAKSIMLGKQMGVPSGKKEPKNPDQDYQAAFYRMPDDAPGFPTIAFKAAAVSAARQVDGLTMTFLRGAFHVIGELVAIEGTSVMREDMVRVGMGTADIRYRPEFSAWAVNLIIRLNIRSMTLEQLIHLLNQAGFSVGVGEWRPEKNGRNGMFHVASMQEVTP
jgi:hypothetical protein